MLKQAESRFILARNTYNRFLKLKEKGVVSKQRFDEIENNFNIAKANFFSAKIQIEASLFKFNSVKAKLKEMNTLLKYTKITSPFDGVIIEKFVNRGDTVYRGTPLLTLQTQDNYQIKCQVPESYIDFIKLGEKLKILLKDKQIEGIIRAIVLQGNTFSRSFPSTNSMTM